MILLIWLVLALMAIALFVIFGALVEMYRALEQVRVQSGAVDFRTKLDANADNSELLQLGIPTESTSAGRRLLLVLSDRCSTCELIAERLAGGPPQDVSVVVQPHSEESVTIWLRAHSLDNSDNVVIDADEAIVDALGIRISPAAIRLRHGEIVAAHTVPSPRRLQEDLQWLNKGGPDEPEYGPAHETYRAVAAQTSRRVEALTDNNR